MILTSMLSTPVVHPKTNALKQNGGCTNVVIIEANKRSVFVSSLGAGFTEGASRVVSLCETVAQTVLVPMDVMVPEL